MLVYMSIISCLVSIKDRGLILGGLAGEFHSIVWMGTPHLGLLHEFQGLARTNLCYFVCVMSLVKMQPRKFPKFLGDLSRSSWCASLLLIGNKGLRNGNNWMAGKSYFLFKGCFLQTDHFLLQMHGLGLCQCRSWEKIIGLGGKNSGKGWTKNTAFANRKVQDNFRIFLMCE